MHAVALCSTDICVCVCVQMQDEFLKALAEDTVLYVRTVCNTIIMEVPKAIVHCQVSACIIPPLLS